ncbi:hypothetical protein [Allocoleopsis franciscana]|uniref:Uncharacterized protein n=1 Tax=Allocoleopsis franciscana PCC 7113 TaxID=1173027 RepID=K9WID3_9CYAN|nr:hypothetical protein [Allocoleopsis franciscana]AFZ19539.1 hypothetical protein Mic7113_3822 [Allocoleopsis franciscana PCC 7113]
MSKFKMAALISLVCLMGVVFYSVVVFSQAPQPSVRLLTEPPISQILPFDGEASVTPSPVKLTLQVVDAAGQSLENAKIRLQILTPPKSPWFPTDFPIVEGTQLLNIEAVAPKGELQIQQILPIRGQYQLLVEVIPMVEKTFSPFQQTLTLSVPENWIKYRNLGILVLVLLTVGVGGGLVLGGRQEIQEGEIAPQRVRFLLSGAVIVAIISLLFINITAELAESHTDHHKDHYPKLEEPAILQSQGIEARILGDIEATVGQLANLAVQVRDTQTGQPVTDANLNIKATSIEGEWVAFAYQGVTDTKGQLKWEQQFFDGAPHKVTVEVSPQPQAQQQFSPLKVVKQISVEGVAPPLQSRLIVLSYFTSFIVLGLGIGIQLRRRLVWQ